MKALFVRAPGGVFAAGRLPINAPPRRVAPVAGLIASPLKHPQP